MWAPASEDSYFANMEYSKNVVNILPSAEMLVSFRGEMMRPNKRACLLYAERMDFKELIVSNSCKYSLSHKYSIKFLLCSNYA